MLGLSDEVSVPGTWSSPPDADVQRRTQAVCELRGVVLEVPEVHELVADVSVRECLRPGAPPKGKTPTGRSAGRGGCKTACGRRPARTRCGAACSTRPTQPRYCTFRRVREVCTAVPIGRVTVIPRRPPAHSADLGTATIPRRSRKRIITWAGDLPTFLASSRCWLNGCISIWFIAGTVLPGCPLSRSSCCRNGQPLVLTALDFTPVCGHFQISQS